jgi:flagellar biosynthesis anti-sigma factor FlgM
VSNYISHGNKFYSKKAGIKIYYSDFLEKLNTYLNATDKVSGDKDDRVKDSHGASTASTLCSSDRSREIETAREVIGLEADLRQAKVKALKRAIDEGRYSVSSAALADSIIESALIDALL